VTRIKALVSFAVVLMLGFLAVAQPVPAGAADCSAEKAAIDQLGTYIDRLTNDLQKQMQNLDAAKSDLAADAQRIEDLQRNLSQDAPLAASALADSALTRALTALGLQVTFSIALIVAGPEGWALLPHTLASVLEMSHLAYAAYEDYQLYSEGSDALAMMDQLTSELGNLDAARAFAEEQGLPQVTLMVDDLANLSAATKAFDQALSRIKAALNAIAGDQKLLKMLAMQLAADLEAYYACLDQPGPVPNNCEGQPTSPTGIGVCR
jgi:Tfp pilus assembly protein PilN